MVQVRQGKLYVILSSLVEAGVRHVESCPVSTELLLTSYLSVCLTRHGSVEVEGFSRLLIPLHWFISVVLVESCLHVVHTCFPLPDWLF